MGDINGSQIRAKNEKSCCKKKVARKREKKKKKRNGHYNGLPANFHLTNRRSDRRNSFLILQRRRRRRRRFAFYVLNYNRRDGDRSVERDRERRKVDFSSQDFSSSRACVFFSLFLSLVSIYLPRVLNLPPFFFCFFCPLKLFVEALAYISDTPFGQFLTISLGFFGFSFWVGFEESLQR